MSDSNKNSSVASRDAIRRGSVCLIMLDNARSLAWWLRYLRDRHGGRNNCYHEQGCRSLS